MKNEKMYLEIYEYDLKEHPGMFPLEFTGWLTKEKYGEIRHKYPISLMDIDRLIRNVHKKVEGDGMKVEILRECASYFSKGLNIKQVIFKLDEYVKIKKCFDEKRGGR